MGQALNAAPPDLPGLFAVVRLHSAWRTARFHGKCVKMASGLFIRLLGIKVGTARRDKQRSSPGRFSVLSHVTSVHHRSTDGFQTSA